MSSLAEMRALAAARRAPSPATLLEPNDDKDDLLRSYQRPVGGQEAGAPALVEAVGPPAAAAPAAVALRHPSPGAGTCHYCHAEVLFVGRMRSMVDPKPVRVLPQSELAGRQLPNDAPAVFGWTEDGRGIVGWLVPEASTTVYESHVRTCPPNARSSEGRRTYSTPHKPSSSEIAKDEAAERWRERVQDGGSHDPR